MAEWQQAMSSAEFTEWLAHYALCQEESEDKVHWNDLKNGGADLSRMLGR